MQSLWKEMRNRSSHRHLNFATHVQPWHGHDGRSTLRVKKFTKGEGCTWNINHETKHTTKKSTTQQNAPTHKKHVISSQMKRIRFPLILLQREMEEVNTCNVKMKKMDERQIADDKRGLVRDKAVDRSKCKTEAMVWLEEEVFQSLSQ